MDEYESLIHSTQERRDRVVFIPKCRRKVLYGYMRRCPGEVFALHQQSRWYNYRAPQQVEGGCLSCFDRTQIVRESLVGDPDVVVVGFPHEDAKDDHGNADDGAYDRDRHETADDERRNAQQLVPLCLREQFFLLGKEHISIRGAGGAQSSGDLLWTEFGDDHEFSLITRGLGPVGGSVEDVATAIVGLVYRFSRGSRPCPRANRRACAAGRHP